MNKLIIPNLFVIGFPKCATTTLYSILNSHPEVFMTRYKKPDYFMFKSFQIGLDDPHVAESERQVLNWKLNNIQNHQMPKLKSYEFLFKGSESFNWRGEASHYSNFPRVPLAIKSEGISPRILVAIRNPVDRFVSHYDMMVNNGIIKESFNKFFQYCLDLEETRKDWLYTQRSPLSSGLYGEYLKPYIEVFGKDNVLILLFEELKKDYFETCQIIFKWLNVNANFKPEFIQRSVGGQFSNKFIQNLNMILRGRTLLPLRAKIPVKFKKALTKLGRRKTIISGADAEMVRRFYSNDIEELQHLIQCKIPY